MKTTSQSITVEVYQSEIMADVASADPRDRDLIVWADAHPEVYELVTTRKSQAFGLGSCAYIGWAQLGMDPGAILARLRHFKAELDGTRMGGEVRSMNDFWRRRARFTLAHFQDRDFKTGFFQQFDGSYDRGCQGLDYTPGTRDEVVREFMKWCFNGACDYDMSENGGVKIDKIMAYTMDDLRRIGAVVRPARAERGVRCP